MVGKARRASAPARATAAATELLAMSTQVFGEPLYTVQQVALALGVTAETIRDWIKAGDLIALRFGHKEYRIAESALRQYKHDREEEAKQEYEARRADRRAETEAARLRAQDPEAHWQRTLCPACGKNKVLTTRHQRKDGGWMCSECEELSWQVHKRTAKDCAERTARMRAAEYNAEAGVQPGATPQYVVYLCGVCREPCVLPAFDVLTLAFYPQCYHSGQIFHGHSEAEEQGRYDPRVITALALLERELRAAYWREENEQPASHLSPWALSDCPRCRVNPVVVCWDGRAMTVPDCRECQRAYEASLDEITF